MTQDGGPQQGGDAGISLRDWFAGQVINGLMSNPERNRKYILSYTEATEKNIHEAFLIADAMIAERDKAKGDQT